LFNWLLVILMMNSNTLIVTRIYNLKVLASLSHQKSWFYGLKLRNYYYFMTIFLMTLPGIIWQNRIWDEARRNESRAEVPKREDVAQWTIISRPKLPNIMGSNYFRSWIWSSWLQQLFSKVIVLTFRARSSALVMTQLSNVLITDISTVGLGNKELFGCPEIVP
jgi:hypothetical protein